MLSSFNAAVTAGSPGIATTVVSATAFTAPINSALQAGIPVVTYNANGATNSPTNGLAYIGQELYISGQAVGTRLASLMKKGDTAVGVIAQPGSLNIQPRLDGATQALEAAGMKVMFGSKGLNAGASATQEAQVNPLSSSRRTGPRSRASSRSTAATPPCSAPHWPSTTWSARSRAGGFDLEPQTLTAISAGEINFTVDQSPYLQGFLPVIYLYLWQLSGGLVAPPVTNTGLKFVVKGNVGAYTAQTTRVEGSTSAAEVHQAHRADLDLTVKSRDTGNCGSAAAHRRRKTACEPPRHLGMTSAHKASGDVAGLG